MSHSWDGTKIRDVIRLLKNETAHWANPVVTEYAVNSQDPFLVLISCILSLRTKDKVTAEASDRLFGLARTPQAMLRLSLQAIRRAIYPVGFYRTKARSIRGISQELLGRFQGRVPEEMEALLSLPGVGRKTANLVLTEAFSKPGLCVDTHVHRISNRWGLISTRNPYESEMALRKTLPRRYWKDYNRLLVNWGQHVYLSISPFCSKCRIENFCAKVGLGRRR